jgi:hypothetical protein
MWRVRQGNLFLEKGLLRIPLSLHTPDFQSGLSLKRRNLHELFERFRFGRPLGRTHYSREGAITNSFGPAYSPEGREFRKIFSAILHSSQKWLGDARIIFVVCILHWHGKSPQRQCITFCGPSKEFLRYNLHRGRSSLGIIEDLTAASVFLMIE